MASESFDLLKDEVKTRLKYQDASITDELYSFGTMLVQDAVDRMGKLDSQAGALAAYCGGLITILIATFNGWSKLQSQASISLIAMAATIVFLSGICAIISMALQKTKWFSQDDWIKKDCLTSADRLRRYHVLAMWNIVDSHHTAYRKKILMVYAAQLLLAMAGVVLNYLSLTLE